MFHCSNLLSENLGGMKGECVPVTPTASWAGAFFEARPGCPSLQDVGPGTGALISALTPALSSRGAHPKHSQ